MNVVILSGNLARDPEVRFTPTGKAVTEATVCVSERWTDSSGQQKETTAFVALVFWGPRGEAFAKHHRKGSKAMVRGKIVQDTWDDKTTGKKQTKTKVQVEEWEFAGSKPSDAPAAPTRQPEPYRPQSSDWPDMTAQNNPTTPPKPPEDDSLDVPF